MNTLTSKAWVAGALTVACVRGLREFVLLQRCRARDWLRRQG